MKAFARFCCFHWNNRKTLYFIHFPYQWFGRYARFSWIFTKHSLMWFHDNISMKMFLFEDQISSDHKSNMNHRFMKYLLHSYLKFQFVFISTCRERATYFSVCFKFFLWLHQIQKSISYLAYKSLLEITRNSIN